MSRRRSSESSISLFPFLAVLVCTMGALILLLIAMTQKLHRNAVARLAAERAQAEMPVEPASLPSAPPPPVEPVYLPDAPPLATAPPSGPSAEELRQLALERQREKEARRQEILAERARAAAELEQSWSAQVAAAKRRRDAEIEAARRAAAERDAMLKSVQSVAQTKGGTVKNLSAMAEREAELHQTSAVLEQNAAELGRTAQQLRHEIEQAKRRQATGPSPYALVPYDGTSGTVRRPIYIECTDVGLRFLPEGETITAADLQGFNEGYNPLLAGTAALLRYWKAQSEASGGGEPEPYVLLLVRPSGSVAYYIARKLLTRLEVPFGYELIAEDWKLDVPDPDPNARKIVKAAVADAISTRDELADALGGPGGGGRGTGRRGGAPGSSGEFGEVDAFPGSAPARPRNVRDIPAGEAGTSPGLPTQPEELPLGPGSGRGLGTGPRLTVTPGGGPSDTPGTPASPGLNGGGKALRPSGTGTGAAVGTGPAIVPGPNGRGDAEYATLGLGNGANGNAGGGRPPRPAGAAGESNGEFPDRLTGLPAPGEDDNWRSGGAPGSELAETPGTGVGEAESESVGQRSNGPGQRRIAGTTQGLKSESPGSPGTAGENGAEGSSTGSPGAQPSGGEESNVSFSRQFGPKPDEYDPSARAAQSGGSSDGQASSSSGRGANGEAIKKRWGMTNGRATIGLEKKLEIHCLPNKILVGPNDATITCDGSETKEQLVRDVLSAIEQISLGWGKPPRNFYWIPVVKFVVYPGGNQHYERLHNGLREWGLFSSVEYTVREAPRKSFSGALK